MVDQAGGQTKTVLRQYGSQAKRPARVITITSSQTQSTMVSMGGGVVGYKGKMTVVDQHQQSKEGDGNSNDSIGSGGGISHAATVMVSVSGKGVDTEYSINPDVQEVVRILQKTSTTSLIFPNRDSYSLASDARREGRRWLSAKHRHFQGIREGGDRVVVPKQWTGSRITSSRPHTSSTAWRHGARSDAMTIAGMWAVEIVKEQRKHSAKTFKER
ncbi:uncharacterized protein EI90DRAFT_3020881 [Cantharellus anzutake]|uniref:uncharacterized protein n=1 Tax=Cantharellus anzutake TaxID=1750568 RepID=UPI001904A432|nr:uncharacterized protein EI90DRAFT_3020881 [Cantharellus anzutake]KAF8318907.1 hypothetical protein EI90DRAFT_3020881 [Cantharellus anzutake]